VLVGAGSGGARVAQHLVQNGIGRIVLVDRPGEVLLEHNIVRHICRTRISDEPRSRPWPSTSAT